MAVEDLRNWSTELRSNMSRALNKIASNLGPNDKVWVENQIEKIRTELTDGYGEIINLRSSYKELIRKYFEKNKPFSSLPSTFQSDLKQYRALIAHTIVLEDLSFLEYWGVLYPRAQNFEVLAGEAPDDYIMAFGRICDDEKYRKANDIPEVAVPYYRQLQEWLSS